MDKLELVNYLKEYLKLSDDRGDDSQNWIQVDNTKSEIKKIWYAVDANTYIFDMAIDQWCDMILTHHWILWSKPINLTGLYYDRISRLINNDIALYSVHLPLDAHPEVWNNIWIAKAFLNVFGISKYKMEWFGYHHWYSVWYWLRFDQKIPMASIISVFCEQMWFQKSLYNFAKKDYISSVSIISWWAWSGYTEALEKGYDLYITWEGFSWDLVTASEQWASILLWWHRETEKIWVKLLAHHLTQKFSVETVFLDRKY